MFVATENIVVPSHSQVFSVIPSRLAVPSSRGPVAPWSRGPAVPDSVWVGKNLPAMCERYPQYRKGCGCFVRKNDPQCERRPAKCEGRGALGGGRAVSQFCWRATQSFSGILRCSHSFPVNRAPLVVHYRLAVPESTRVGKNLPAKY